MRVMGLSLNVKGNKVRSNAGIPGTGLSYRSSQKRIFPESPKQTSTAIVPTWLGIIILVFAAYIFVRILS